LVPQSANPHLRGLSMSGMPLTTKCDGMWFFLRSTTKCKRGDV
jgi:hypothetical protein